MVEMLEVYDEAGQSLGVVSRGRAHREGLWHRVVHGWLVEDGPEGRRVYFQRRALTKKDFPGLYDIAAAGHIDPGEDRDEAMIRETGEELGLILAPEALAYLGQVRESFPPAGGFRDREICEVYRISAGAPAFRLGEEVDDMVYVNLIDFERWLVQGGALPARDLEGRPRTLSRANLLPHSEAYQRLLVQALKA
ncbi:NUDIX hydrolase [Gehongia tenuis]|uniref:NUDIX domain-containing protein n=1 Tax=Gehongia tenuis TaxID=2763655 RepID=A0A926D2V5_9FIRM|nr:NUDIX domain-containing protein [Gehongia tenuis]MBC8530497.1 NUDIX domain-containing protein [Gehongia tenuis]